MVREVITVAALTAAFSFLGGCTPRAATLPGFRSETKEFSQSGETFGNPLMGYAPDARRENVSEDITLLYVDITWKELEPECGVYDWDTIEKENQFFRWRSEGKHLVLRFICDDPGDESHTDIPDWLYRETGKDGDWYDHDQTPYTGGKSYGRTLGFRFVDQLYRIGQPWSLGGMACLLWGRNSQIAVGRSKGAVCEGMAGGISECDDPDAQTILFCKKIWIWSVQ